MKTINHEELYANINEFLKGKGVELKDGTYPQVLQKGCAIIADGINASEAGLEKAKDGVLKKMDQLRQFIHQKTAPQPASAQSKATQPPIIEVEVSPPPKQAKRKPSAKQARTKPKTRRSPRK